MKIEVFKKVIKETLELKPCGFERGKTCTTDCKYYETCTRNPYKKKGEKE